MADCGGGDCVVGGSWVEGGEGVREREEGVEHEVREGCVRAAEANGEADVGGEGFLCLFVFAVVELVI